MTTSVTGIGAGAGAGLSVTVPRYYGYVLLTLTSSTMLSAWHGFIVQSKRTRANIPYPLHFASVTLPLDLTDTEGSEGSGTSKGLASINRNKSIPAAQDLSTALSGSTSSDSSTAPAVSQVKRTVPFSSNYTTPAAANINAYIFNCAQRAHSNFLEHYPTFVISSLIGGLGYPLSTSCLGLLWMVGRVLYAHGYWGDLSRRNGEGRHKGWFYVIAEMGLVGLAGRTGWEVLVGGLGLLRKTKGVGL